MSPEIEKIIDDNDTLSSDINPGMAPSDPGDFVPVGQALFYDIQEILQGRIDICEEDPNTNEFVFVLDELNDCIDNIKNIDRLDFSYISYLINKESRVAASKQRKVHIDQHLNQLRSNKVLVYDHEKQENTWKAIPPDLKDKFSEKIQMVQIPEMPKYEEVSDTPVSNEMIDYVFGIIDSVIIKKVQELAINIPLKEDYGIFTNEVNGIVYTSDLLGRVHYIAPPKNERVRKIKREAHKLQKLVQEFNQQPETAITKWIINAHGSLLGEWIEDYIDKLVVKSNTEMYEAIEPQKFKESKKRSSLTSEEGKKPTKRKKTKLVIDELDIEKQQTIDTMDYRIIEDVSISLPWIEHGDPRTLNVTELYSNGHSVYIIDGIEEKLKSISDEVQKKAITADKIQNTIKTQANLIFAGHMPWNLRTGIAGKKLTNNSRSDSHKYRHEYMWYSFDKSPNTPRVYFTLKDSGDIEVSSGKDRKLSEGAKCLVIVGITDKQNQVKVLQCLTGNTHSALKANGAGSI